MKHETTIHRLLTALPGARAQATGASADPLPLLDCLAQTTKLSPETLQTLASAELGIVCLSQHEILALQPDFSHASYSQCIAGQYLIASNEDGLLLCTDDPWDSALIARLARKIGQIPAIRWARGSDIIEALRQRGDSMQAVSVTASKPSLVDEDHGPEISLESIERTSNPVVRFVDAAILDAWKSGASDIHFETQRNTITLKYRLDGVLVEAGSFDDAGRIEEVLNRIKVIAGLDISERRIPQDGRFRARFKDRHVDFRVSIMPSIHGEDAVVRVLDKSHLKQADSDISLAALGFPEDHRNQILRLSREPHGMLLVAGPTGSGKTTTLYAVLLETRSSIEKIITIEDPVEYELPGVLQIPVNEKKGLSFSRGLRSILRHDPDRLLVGEIRDPETAEIAVQAALTGHGVLTTVHANNGFDAINRFIHMGVDLYAFAAATNGIISQRLMRKVCPACAQARALGDDFMKKLSGIAQALQPATPLLGRGCPECRHTGYRGRFAVSEVLSIDDELRQMIITRAPMQEFKLAVAARGIRSLREQAMHAVLSGITTEEEYHRVVAAQ